MVDAVPIPTEPSHRPWLAFWCGAGVAIFCGLIGLGGAEFRLPLLLSLFALVAHQAVRINLLVSFATLAAAAVARFGFVRFPDLATIAPIIAAITLGAMASAWLGAGWLAKLSPRRLTVVIGVLLLGISALLVAEGVIHAGFSGGVIYDPLARVAVALIAGLGIGAASSLLGVAGGELIIPTLILVFGVDVRTAGTASLLIAIPTVLVGVLRHFRAGAYRSPPILMQLVLPMSLGSAMGALLGAALLPLVSSGVLKLTLAAILAISAVKLLHRSQQGVGRR